MASYQFRNTKTGETKIVNSKDSQTAKRVYSSRTWEYIKAVPQQTKQSKHVKPQELWSLSCQVSSQINRLKQQAEEYDVRFAMEIASNLEELMSKMQSALR